MLLNVCFDIILKHLALVRAVACELFVDGLYVQHTRRDRELHMGDFGLRAWAGQASPLPRGGGTLEPVGICGSRGFQYQTLLLTRDY